jgi:2'-5' RNA ligase
MRHVGLALLAVAAIAGCGTQVEHAVQAPASGVRAAAKAPTAVSLGRDVYGTAALAPVLAVGPKESDNALALNVPYAPVRALRAQLDRALGHELDFFKRWNPVGEAHVTVINPVEYYRVLAGGHPEKPLVSIERIGAIAREMNIQSADLKVLGLGSGEATLNGKAEQTYFLVVESKKLRAIRARIHREFVANGGDAKAWDPASFYPHVTVGYTLRDLHESDGVLKDMAHAADPRFKLVLHP